MDISERMGMKSVGEGVETEDDWHLLREIGCDLVQGWSIARAMAPEHVRWKTRSLHDVATGLPNRDLFNDRLTHAISLAERHQWTLAVMFLDLDRFKSINDNHGHAAGDMVLKEIARRMLQHARDEDTVCRNGGDEFLYLLVNPQGAENVERIARQILATIALPIGVPSCSRSRRYGCIAHDKRQLTQKLLA